MELKADELYKAAGVWVWRGTVKETLREDRDICIYVSVYMNMHIYIYIYSYRIFCHVYLYVYEFDRQADRKIGQIGRCQTKIGFSERKLGHRFPFNVILRAIRVLFVWGSSTPGIRESRLVSSET